MKKKKKTQLQFIEKELKSRRKRGITSLYAFRCYGITRLSAIIYTLRHTYGYDIKSDRVAIKNKYGDKVYFARYILKDTSI